MTTRSLRAALVSALILSIATVPSSAQVQTAAGSALRQSVRAASELDVRGRTAEARAMFQQLIDSAATPAIRAQMQRSMAMSYAFDGDCDNTVKYELMVIDYWKTRETQEPQNAFYQQGEMANEAARVCIDAGTLDSADKYYRLGTQLGLKEPSPKTHPRSLWDFRLAHALGRLAARKGNASEARRQVAAARRILEADSAMAAQQSRFFPYLAGYVALFTNDLATAEVELTKALAIRGNDRDPFMHVLLGMTYERRGDGATAATMYRKAYELATSHNPPAAFARPFARQKLGIQDPD